MIYDWARASHKAFELPMAATAWLFGLEHFSHASNLAWPVVIGAVLFVAYFALSGLVFTRLADAIPAVRRPGASLAAGLGWGFVSFLFFWDMLLPIGRDGAPFRAPGSAALYAEPTFVAPNWVFILGFTLMGLVTGVSYSMLRGSPAARMEADAPDMSAPGLRHAA